MAWHHDLGVRGESIATAALGCVSVRQQRQKQTSMVQMKCYKSVKGNPLVLQTSKVQDHILTFHFSVNNVIFSDSEVQEKSDHFVDNLTLVI